MAAYARLAEVEEGAGGYASLFSVAGKQADEDTVESLLADVSAELDAAIAARGHATPVSDAGAKAALVDTTAYGALARALASVPSGDKGLDDLKAYAQALWSKALDAVAKGTHAALALLEAGGGGATAGDLWSEEPGFGTPEQVKAEAQTLTASLAPAFAKGQPL